MFTTARLDLVPLKSMGVGAGHIHLELCGITLFLVCQGQRELKKRSTTWCHDPLPHHPAKQEQHTSAKRREAGMLHLPISKLEEAELNVTKLNLLERDLAKWFSLD